MNARTHRAVWTVCLLLLAGGAWCVRSCGPEQPPVNAATPPVSAAAAISQPFAPAPAPPAPDAPAPARRAMPPHSCIIALIFTASAGGIQVTERTTHAGQLKPFPAPEGRVGLYFRLKDKSGALICDGMLPDPFEVRAIPPRPGDAPLPGPPPQKQEAVFSVRLPEVPDMGALELFRVPRSATPADPRDRAEWLLGTFPLSD